MYLNGTFSNSITTSTVLRKGSQSIKIGFDTQLESYTNMTLDELKLFNRTLSANQINQIYNDTRYGYSNVSTIAGNETISGENWTCEVTPNDAKLDGILKNNSTTIGSDFSVAIDLSTKLGQRTNWTLISLPAYNQSAEGNNGTGVSEYFVNVSESGGNAD